MRWGERIVALFAYAAVGMAASSAFAQTSYVDQDTQILAAFAKPNLDRTVVDQVLQEQARLLLFSTADLWRQGGFTHAGVLWAPSGLDRDGPVLKLMFGGGIYHYLSGALGNADVFGRQLAGELLPGWRFVRGGLTVTVFLGLDYQQHRLIPDDPSAGLRGSYVGARTSFELWYQPTPSMMVAADASFSTIGPGYNVRLATGWRVFDAFYLGPEAQAFGAEDSYRQYRAGVHVTGLRTGAFEWSAATGWAIDTDDRSGAYGKLSVFTRR